MRVPPERRAALRAILARCGSVCDADPGDLARVVIGLDDALDDLEALEVELAEARAMAAGRQHHPGRRPRPAVRC